MSFRTAIDLRRRDWIGAALRLLGVCGLSISLSVIFQTGVLHWKATLTQAEVTSLLDQFSEANSRLQSSNTEAKNYALCLMIPKSQASALKEKGTQTCIAESPIDIALGYRIKRATTADGTPAWITQPEFFYKVDEDNLLGGLPLLGRIRKLYVSASVDTMMRAFEKIAFNQADQVAADVKLCAGSRTPLTSDQCAISLAAANELVRDPNGIGCPRKPNETCLSDVIDEQRVRSLFFGVIQCLTLAIFFFALFEALALWVQYVAARPSFFGQQSDGVGRKELVNAAIADRMYVSTMQTVRPHETRLSAITTLGSLRQALTDDAVSKQDKLEMLGDTMLKLAFLGTVYGISAAMFAARGLDTADPVARLSVKADMYSGIGVGFGTTLVGIALSILAAAIRTLLNSAWHGRIDDSYRQVLRYIQGAPEEALIENGARLRQTTLVVPREENVTMPDRDDWISKGLRGLAILGLLGLVVTAVVLVYQKLR